MFYEVIINKTSKVGREEFCCYDQTRTTYKTKQEVATFLGSEYCYVKTMVPTYHDDYQGQVGTIYCWKDRENGKTVYCRDWIAVYETTRKPTLVRRDRR